MSGSPDYVVLCVLARLAKMSRQQVSAASLGGKYLRRVNAIAPASTWMVRYAISSSNSGNMPCNPGNTKYRDFALIQFWNYMVVNYVILEIHNLIPEIHISCIHVFPDFFG